MPRIDLLLCAIGFLPACGSGSTAPSATDTHVVRYSGTVSQPAPGGFLVYKLSGAWTLDAKNALVSGTDTLRILDARVYGTSGTAMAVLKTRCVTVVGKDAWSENEVVTTTDPQNLPIGTVGVTRLSLASGAPKGGGGPAAAWYPSGNVCADRPAAMPTFDFAGGFISFP